MNDRILFTEEMVKAIENDLKTHTRRVVKLPSWSTGNWDDFECDEYGTPLVICDKTGCWAEVKPPHGEAGTHLLVCEKHAIECPYGPAKGCDNPDHVIYWSSEEPIVRDSITAKWRPSIFMPRWASRHALEVKTVRIKRLHEMTDLDYFAEGIENLGDGVGRFNHKVSMAQELFIELWNNINAKRGYAWHTNPRVWDYEFQRVAPQAESAGKGDNGPQSALSSPSNVI